MPRKPNVAVLMGKIASALKPLKVRWYVFGAQAVIAAGAVRSTADIDITVEETDAKALLRALRAAGFVLRRDIEGVEKIVGELRVLPLEHRDTGFQLDVVRAGPGLEELMLGRAITRRVGRSRIPFIQTNDLVMLKILAGRGKDLDDVRALLRLGLAELDLDVIRQRLRELEQLLDDSTYLVTLEGLISEAKK